MWTISIVLAIYRLSHRRYFCRGWCSMTVGDLYGILTASKEIGLRRLLFHPDPNLGTPEWRIISSLGGKFWELPRNGYWLPTSRNLAISADDSISKGFMSLLRKIDVREIGLLSLLNSHNFSFYKTVCQQNLSTLNQITELKEKRSYGQEMVGVPVGLACFQRTI